MASPQPPETLEELPEAVVDAAKKGISVVWLLPIVALLAGGWLVYKTLSERGPEISVSFETAEGIQEGKTEVKLKDVTVGTVNTVEFSNDLSRVLVRMNMSRGVAKYLTDRTRFWVVRPRIGAGEVSGLGTLVSGAYIAMDPSDAGKSVRDFTGLEKPPVITGDRKGTSYRLVAKGLGSLSVGSPVYFRQFKVGEVTEYALSEDHEMVEIGIFIESPHDGYVRAGTRFWNTSGVDVSMTASGIKLEVESLISLLSGGITFETVQEGEATPVAEKGHTFKLFRSRSESLEQPITETVTFALRFSDTVRGLDIGAPVEYRGIRIGTVKAIEVGKDVSGSGVLSPVVIIDFEPQRLAAYSTVAGAEEAGKDREEMAEDPVARTRRQVAKHGLRARLQTGNLVTGKRFVDFDFFPDAPPATITKTGKYLEIPTVPSSLEGIIAGIQRLLDKLDKADLGGTLANLNRLMISTSNLMVVLEKDAPGLSSELHATLVNAREMLKQAADTLKTVDHAASPEGEIGNQLQDALKEISTAARSIRVMAEYLERHPEAMLKGKSTP